MSSLGLVLLLASPQEDFTFLLRRLPAPALAEGILADIMMHLDMRDVLACRLVNKTWSRAAATVIRHVNVPCKAVATTANAAGGESVDVGLRRLHRMWPVAAAVTLSGLAAGRALNEELSLQLLANHLSRWRNLKEINLLDMPVTPATTFRLTVVQQLHRPQVAAAAAAPSYDRGGTAMPSTSDQASTTGASNTAPGEVTAASIPECNRTNRSVRGGGSNGSGGGDRHARSSSPGPWGLGCLSCCLGLTRLHVELVPASEGISAASWRQRQQRWGRWGPQQPARRPDPAQLAAGQAVLLEGLTRLTRLTHLCVKLLELPDQDLEDDGEPAEAEAEGSTDSELEAVVKDTEEALVGALWCEELGAGRQGVAGTAAGAKDAPPAAAAVAPISLPSATAAGTAEAAPLAVVTAATPAAAAAAAAAGAAAAIAAAAADDYLLDIEEAGNYGSDLDMDLDLGQDWKSCNGRGTASNADKGSISKAEVTPVHGSGLPGCSRPVPDLQGQAGGYTINPSSADTAASCQQHPRQCPGEHGGMQLPLQPTPHNSSVGGGSGGGSYSYNTASDSVDGVSHSVSGSVSCSSSDGSSDSGGGATVTAPTVSNRWIPHPSLFARMGPRLRSLRLVGCDLQGGGALAALAGVLTCLTSLSLQGRLELTRNDLGALSSLRDLRDLSLSGVDLVYGQDDLDDYPQDLMAELYGALQQLRHFQSLKFEVNSHRCIGLHSSWLPLEDVPLSHLRSLSLSLTLDSGHALQILAELTSLTALSLSYMTCPVALYSDDMTALAPLTGLRRFSLRHDPSERDFIISLSGGVVQDLAGAWTQLSQLAFSGQIEPDVPGKPSLECLASWTSLRDLSLTAVPEEQISLWWFRHTATTATATTLEATDTLGGGSRSWGPGGDDDDNREAARAAGALDLGVALGRCLPPGLTRLELSGVRLRGGELLQLLTGPMTGLTSLQVLDCGLTPAHLMVGDCGATQLQVLILNDNRSWRACHSWHHPHHQYQPKRQQSRPGLPGPLSRLPTTASTAPSAGAVAAATAAIVARQKKHPSHNDHGSTPQQPGPHPPAGRSGPQSLPGLLADQAGADSHTHPHPHSYPCCCSCCCSPNIWSSQSRLACPATHMARARLSLPYIDVPRTAVHAVRGNGGWSTAARLFRRSGPSPGQPHNFVGNHQSQQQGTEERHCRGQEPQGWRLRYLSASSRSTGLSEDGFGSVRGGGDGMEQGFESDCFDQSEVEGGPGAEGNGTGGRSSCGGSGGSCCCWRRRFIRHGLATLGSLRSLEFMLLGLPDDELSAAEVLRPLSVLTGLRYLTLRVPGMQAAATGEVSAPLERMMQLRCLNLAGPRADSAAARGAEDAARRMPYLKC